MLKLNIRTEFGTLRDVVLATVKNYVVTEPVNLTQEKYYASEPPQHFHLLREQENFVKVLEQNQVDIHWAKPLPQCPLQVNTRDIAAVIGDVLVLGRLKWPMRQDELLGIQQVIETVGDKLLRMPDSGLLEGGDIVVHYPTIYLGLGERTDTNGFEFIKSNFGTGWEVIPLKLRKDILHLDVVFNVVAYNTVLLFPEAFVSTPLSFFEERFEHVIAVTEGEQFDLATNVFALNPKKLVADRRNYRVSNMLRSLSFEVIELDFTHTTRIGGSFRCATLPLLRDE